VGHIDPQGYVQLTDRAKDVIKSGGEWISSVDLEDAILSHSAEDEVAVIAIADERWQERPLAIVVPKPGAAVEPAELRAHLQSRVARFWVPEYWAFQGTIPKTSVGKMDKVALRKQVETGQLVPQVDKTDTPS